MTPSTRLSTAVKVLFVTAEIAPWVKTGGLGDVSAALPPALARAGCDVRVLVPAYPALKAAFPDAKLLVDVPGLALRLPPCRILDAGPLADGARLLLLDCESRFARPGNPYQDANGNGWPDNGLRFGLLSRVAHWLADNGAAVGWQADVVHSNDWHAALVPAFRTFLGGGRPSVVTIHNLAFQGLFGPELLSEVGLPGHAFRYDAVEFHGKLSFLKSGLQLAERITTVSPNYAAEIQTPEFGAGLDALLRFRAAELSGILNGIDLNEWNPERDPHIAASYGIANLQRKALNKAALQRRLGLLVDPTQPVLGVVSRMTHQKGSDLIIQAAEDLLNLGYQLAVLGAGDHRLEKAFSDLTHRHPHRVVALIGYEESLAHQIEAGADMFLMPSLFEPCGLNQMYSLRYGTPPIVRRTGGLADTVTDTVPDSIEGKRATGFVFDDPTPGGLVAAAARALDAWRQPELWRSLQERGMRKEFGWNDAALRYIEVYLEAMQA